ncbi:MAG: hypothetical protein FWF85_02535 [Clostridiales bacterium]|nr:hypothetical protein [Clostridiales bacterium]
MSVLNELKAYRATGLSPERAAELAEADREGQLAVLPCKLGDTVYWISILNESILQGKVHSMKLSNFGIDFEILLERNLVGRECARVFLTRKEAEAALAQQKAGDKWDS